MSSLYLCRASDKESFQKCIDRTGSSDVPAAPSTTFQVFLTKQAFWTASWRRRADSSFRKQLGRLTAIARSPYFHCRRSLSSLYLRVGLIAWRSVSTKCSGAFCKSFSAISPPRRLHPSPYCLESNLVSGG